MRRSLPAVAAALLAWPAAALAADGEDAPLGLQSAPARAAEGAGGGTGVARTIAGLLVVIAVIYALTWVLRAIKRANEAQGSGTALRDVATLSLGGNRTLHLVRAGDDLVLLGAGEGGITHIRSYSGEEARELGMLADESADEPAPGTGAGAGALLTTVSRGLPTAPARSCVSQTLDALRRRTVIR